MALVRRCAVHKPLAVSGRKGVAPGDQPLRMDRKEKIVLAKNAIANVARGGAASLVAVLLPPFLTRLMSPERYGIWTLVLQLSAYVGYLDFGIQTAVGRFVAHANERGDVEYRDRIVSTSLVALIAAGIAGLVGISVVAELLPSMFRAMPRALVGDARIAVLLVGSSLAVGLPASVFNGIFIGLRRYEVPAVIIGGSRLFSAVVVVLVVRRGGTLAGMGLALAGVNLASYLLQYVTYRRMGPAIRLSVRQVSRETGRELFDCCLSLTIWSFATLLVTGLDIFLVGVLDFHAVAYYAVAATLITFILGLQNAIFGVLIPEAAILAARNKTSELGQILVSSTRFGMVLLLASGLPLLLATRSILSLWVGTSYADKTVAILRVLVAANIVRLSAVPYAMLLIGTGQQRLVTISPIVEGCSNLLVSVVAGVFLGAIGVAIGTLVGSVMGILCNFVYNMPRTTAIAVDLPTYFKDGILRPLGCAAPFLLAFVGTWLFPNLAAALKVQLLLVSVSSTLIALWAFGLTVSQRSRVLSFFRLGGLLVR
jgi:O-antigen/teichoic acid export membrane protein